MRRQLDRSADRMDVCGEQDRVRHASDHDVAGLGHQLAIEVDDSLPADTDVGAGINPMNIDRTRGGIDCHGTLDGLDDHAGRAKIEVA